MISGKFHKKNYRKKNQTQVLKINNFSTTLPPPNPSHPKPQLKITYHRQPKCAWSTPPNYQCLPAVLYRMTTIIRRGKVKWEVIWEIRGWWRLSDKRMRKMMMMMRWWRIGIIRRVINKKWKINRKNQLKAEFLQANKSQWVTPENPNKPPFLPNYQRPKNPPTKK